MGFKIKKKQDRIKKETTKNGFRKINLLMPKMMMRDEYESDPHFKISNIKLEDIKSSILISDHYKQKLKELDHGWKEYLKDKNLPPSKSGKIIFSINESNKKQSEVKEKLYSIFRNFVESMNTNWKEAYFQKLLFDKSNICCVYKKGTEIPDMTDFDLQTIDYPLNVSIDIVDEHGYGIMCINWGSVQYSKENTTETDKKEQAFNESENSYVLHLGNMEHENFMKYLENNIESFKKKETFKNLIPGIVDLNKHFRDCEAKPVLEALSYNDKKDNRFVIPQIIYCWMAITNYSVIENTVKIEDKEEGNVLDLISMKDSYHNMHSIDFIRCNNYYLEDVETGNYTHSCSNCSYSNYCKNAQIEHLDRATIHLKDENDNMRKTITDAYKKGEPITIDDADLMEADICTTNKDNCLFNKFLDKDEMLNLVKYVVYLYDTKRRSKKKKFKTSTAPMRVRVFDKEKEQSEPKDISLEQYCAREIVRYVDVATLNKQEKEEKAKSNKYERSYKGGTHASPRQHYRAGHWRISKLGKKSWVHGCIVNAGYEPMRYKIDGKSKKSK